jgi:hypothetical protein
VEQLGLLPWAKRIARNGLCGVNNKSIPQDPGSPHRNPGHPAVFVKNAEGVEKQEDELPGAEKERRKEQKSGEMKRAKEYIPHCFCKCAETIEKKEDRLDFRATVCAKCAQMEENAGFVSRRLKREMVAAERRAIPGKVGSNSSNGA